MLNVIARVPEFWAVETREEIRIFGERTICLLHSSLLVLMIHEGHPSITLINDERSIWKWSSVHHKSNRKLTPELDFFSKQTIVHN